MFWEWGPKNGTPPLNPCFNIFNEKNKQTNQPVFCLKPDINILAFADPAVSVENYATQHLEHKRRPEKSKQKNISFMLQ